MTRRMTGFRSYQMAIVALLGATIACSKKAPPSPSAPAIAEKKAPVVIDEKPGQFDPNDPKHGTRKLMNLDAPVYVDGVQVAVLRYGDMIAAPEKMLEGDVPSYRVA